MSAMLPVAAPRLELRYGSLPGPEGPPSICAMFTPSYVSAAERLAHSLRDLSLAHALFEVPSVHRSISLHGSDDLTYTKANIMCRLLELTKRPVLYVDVDCVVRRHPELLFRLLQRGCDFAIRNWLSADPNDAYVPAHIAENADGASEPPRYYRHGYHVDYVGDEQLLCSGAVQLWGNTPAARGLLAAWFATIAAHPGVPDDECLNFTFNNPEGWRAALQPSWLPPSYARYPWWIFDEPVIDHPDIPYQGAQRPVRDPNGRRHFYPERSGVRTPAPHIPRDCVIDVRTGELLRFEQSQWRPVGQRWTRGVWPLTRPFTLPAAP
jgi:hypothetical protein